MKHQTAYRGAHRAATRRRAPDPTEQEIKLQVPEAAWPGLLDAMSGPDSRLLPLHAVHYDTANRELARAKVGLRVRQEGDRWVQTLKAPGAHGLERLEENVPLGAVADGGEAPLPDLARHTSSGARSALQAALGAGNLQRARLEPVFEIRVQRRLRRLSEGDATVEVALDEGELLAGGRRRPVAELELELVEGRMADLLAMARHWRSRWGLWLDTGSKAQRGHLLARGDESAPAVQAVPLVPPQRPGLGPFKAAVLRSCLEQVAANAAQLAAGSASEDHVHQARVGIRRLRTALRELPGLERERRSAEPALVRVFRGLGERRDRTHVLRSIQPLVEAAGGRPLAVPAGFHEGADPGGLVRDGDFQDALFDLWACAEACDSRAGGKSVRKALRRRLDALHGQVTQDGRRFTRLDPDLQHRVRKRLKRLRYLAEFAAPLFGSGRSSRYLAALKPVQDALGRYNDQVMAAGLYRELAADDPGAGFAVRWLEDHRDGEAQACRKALRRLRKAEPFWSR